MRRISAAIVGSSPLARGLRVRRLGSAGDGGIIPARAGFTSASRALSCQPGDHPRSRGVYRYSGLSALTRAGSSPLARGLPADNSDQPPQNRIIPARAGFTVPLCRYGLPAPDHPRSRGVYFLMGMEDSRAEGSSPLARGLRDVLDELVNGVRIIPARAGFTADRCQAPRLCRDHPRSRGVYRPD